MEFGLCPIPPMGRARGLGRLAGTAARPRSLRRGHGRSPAARARKPTPILNPSPYLPGHQHTGYSPRQTRFCPASGIVSACHQPANRRHARPAILQIWRLAKVPRHQPVASQTAASRQRPRLSDALSGRYQLHSICPGSAAPSGRQGRIGRRTWRIVVVIISAQAPWRRPAPPADAPDALESGSLPPATLRRIGDGSSFCVQCPEGRKDSVETDDRTVGDVAHGRHAGNRVAVPL